MVDGHTGVVGLHQRLATGGAHERPRGYRFVLAHRVFLSVLAANFVFVVVGYTLFGYTMPIYA
ncbi:MAG: hypothetical protein ACXWJ1_11395, partial [Caldimonas sp.]